ncbi:AbrB/MazE/SpoVT family DNA-binding domain-containing protein [Virgibacillus natechei]|uniref:AbrB/MazE/SpoVT family DNA-binding domain-containing protein n=1 Tax=Virgibacillus sp. CBA3643 TaxID=2942278 RepID=UPI0035A3BFD9
MIITAQKWGEGAGVRIPQPIAKKYNIVPGTKVQVSDDGEKVILKPVKDKPTLEELLAKCTPENSHEEYFSKPMGNV